MRLKTEERRQKILTVAAEVFHEHGFDGASMAEIAARLGGSKTTLYNYFTSKESIFMATVRQNCIYEVDSTIALLDEVGNDISLTLNTYIIRLSNLLLDPQILAARRMVYGSNSSSEINKEYYQNGPLRGEIAIANFISKAVEVGKIDCDNPRLAAQQLRGLLEFTLIEKCLLGVAKRPSKEEIERIAKKTTEIFLKAYGTKPK